MFTLTHSWQQQLLMLSRWYDHAMAQAELGQLADSFVNHEITSTILDQQNNR